MRDLVDTTEMYLRTIYELEEEGIIPLRAITRGTNIHTRTTTYVLTRRELLYGIIAITIFLLHFCHIIVFTISLSSHTPRTSLFESYL